MLSGCLPAGPLWQFGALLRAPSGLHACHGSTLKRKAAVFSLQFTQGQGQEVVREVEVDILAFILQRLAADGGLAAMFLSHPQLPALLEQAAGTTASDKKVR